MDPTLFLNLLIIIVLAKVGGEILAKLGYPSVVGEIVTGIVLGPSILNLITPNESLGTFSDLGFLLVLLYAGLSLDINQLFEASKRGLVVSIFNVAATMIVGYAVGKMFGYSDLTSVSIGIALSISSVGMGTRVLMDLNKLQTAAGMTLVSVAVIDDVSEIIMLGAVLGISSAGIASASNQIAIQIFKTALFFLVVYVVGFYFKVPERLKKFVENSRTLGTKLSYIFAVLFSTMALAHLTGIHVIIGAFFSGLMLSKSFSEDREMHRTIMFITFGLFAPIAYSWVGLNTMLTALITNLPLLVAVLISGVGAEIIGGGLGSRCAGLNWGESLIVGIGLTGRAGIELAVLEVMRVTGLFNLEIYSSFVVLTAVSCLLMPFMLKFACSRVWRNS